MARGGARPGAGRPRNTHETLQIKITIPINMKNQLKKLGGSKWIVDQILKNLLFHQNYNHLF